MTIHVINCPLSTRTTRYQVITTRYQVLLSNVILEAPASSLNADHGAKVVLLAQQSRRQATWPIAHSSPSFDAFQTK